MRPISAFIVSAVLSPSPMLAQQAAPQEIERVGSAVISRASGGPVSYSQGLRVVSRLSTIELEWFMVTDTTLGIVLDGPVGARAVYDNPWHRYGVDVRIHALDSVAAFEVRVLTFNVWKEFTRTLSFTQLEDLRPGQRKAFNGLLYGVYGEAPLREHVTSIAYIARVRLRDGRTVEADPAPVLRIARTIQAGITEQDLKPKAEPLPPLTRT